jgi:hypothetical protein
LHKFTKKGKNKKDKDGATKTPEAKEKSLIQTQRVRENQLSAISGGR